MWAWVAHGEWQASAAGPQLATDSAQPAPGRPAPDAAAPGTLGAGEVGLVDRCAIEKINILLKYYIKNITFVSHEARLYYN